MTVANTMGVKTKAGRFDFDFNEPGLVKDGSGAVFLTDAPDGPLAMFITLPGNIVAPAHSHSTDTITVVIEGSLRVGKKWFGPGSFRIQERNSIYGPSLTGPDGLKCIVFMADRNGLPDQFAREEDRIAMAPMMAKLAEFARAGGSLPLPDFMTSGDYESAKATV